MPAHNPLIDVAVVGAQKAASTSLHRYMAMHPAFATHPKLEFTYFVRDEEYRKGYESAFRDNFTDYVVGQKILVKNVGLMYWEKAAERLHQHNPDMKLIAVLRNPTDRAWSAFHYARLMGVEALTDFGKAMELGPSRFKNPIEYGMTDYLGRGHYAHQIRLLRNLFGEKNILVILQDELKTDPLGTLQKCFSFCGVDDTFIPDFTVRFNEAGRARNAGMMKLIKRNPLVKKILGNLIPKAMRSSLATKAGEANREKIQLEPLGGELRQRLVEYYRPLNGELSGMIGKDLSDWNR